MSDRGPLKPGERVICIDATKARPLRPGQTMPREGETYTVKWYDLNRGRPLIAIEEIRNPPVGPAFAEPGYAVSRFKRI